MINVKLDEGLIKGDSVSGILDSALDAGGGLLRLTPNWVPRSFLQYVPGLQRHVDGRIGWDPK